jgi:NAD(P)-dependent dehydrogenase (short-subunit alcohol dehydrogenase family)
VVLIGRTAATLEATRSKLAGDTQISVFVGDVTDEVAMQKVVNEVGSWDVLVFNAGYFSSPAAAAKADIGDYWKAYEVRFPIIMSFMRSIILTSWKVNVKSVIICAKAFFPTANPTRASALAVISGSLVLPPAMLVGMSAYKCSKNHGVPCGRKSERLLCIRTSWNG